MKRIPKGWIFRQYPKPFEAIIEGTNYEVGVSLLTNMIGKTISKDIDVRIKYALSMGKSLRNNAAIVINLII